MMRMNSMSPDWETPAFRGSTTLLQVESEAFAGMGARHAGQHHPGRAFGLGEQRVAVLDVAAENLHSAGAAESLLA